MMREVLSAAALLVALCPSMIMALTITCSTGQSVTVTAEAGDSFENWYVNIKDGACGTFLQFTGSAPQSHTFTCYDYTLDTPFEISVVDTISGPITSPSSINTYSATCVSDSTASASGTILVTPPPDTGSVSDTLEAVVTVSQGSVFGIGDTVTSVIALDAAYVGYYTIGVATFTLTYGSQSINAVTAGCPVSTLSAAISGSSTTATSLTVTYDAPYYTQTMGVANTDSQTFTITVTVNLCTTDTSSCFVTDGCSAGVHQYGRKKRETDQHTFVVTKKLNMMVFENEADKQEYLQNMYSELSDMFEPQKDNTNDVCVDKTSSSVILVLLLVGMILCFSATVWMFVKYRKSRKPFNPESVDYSYSNKSFKK